MMDKVIAEKMTVRELDKEIKEMKEGPLADNNQQENGSQETFTIVDPPKEENKEPEGEQKEMNSQESVSNIDITPPANPTSIDIDKIRETAVDINPQTTPATEAPENNSATEFKFVPSFDNADNNDNNAVTVTTEAPTNTPNAFTNLFSTNTSNSALENTVDNNTVPSAIAIPEISVPAATPVLDVAQATTDVKKVITDLQGKGFNVTFTESDDPDSYKINIQINKK